MKKVTKVLTSFLVSISGMMKSSTAIYPSMRVEGDNLVTRRTILNLKKMKVYYGVA